METTVVAPDGVPLAVSAGLTALGHATVAVDLRGHGRTPAAPWSWPAAVADVATVVGRGSESMAELLPQPAQPAWRSYERALLDRLTTAADASPLAELVVTPTAHDVHLERPELLVTLVDGYLRGD